MKRSFVAALASLSLLSSACSEDSDPGKLRPHTPAAATPEPGALPPPTRRLVEGTALPTSPVNLITDPGFALSSEQASFGSFLAFEEESFSQVDLATTLDSRSPAGFGGAVALVKPSGATNTRSTAALLLTSFQGGAGPFYAKVWVSRSDTGGRPVDLAVDEKGVRASVTDETPDGEVFELAPVEDASRTVGGRTWTLLRGEITKGLTYGGFFLIRTGTGGGQFHIAAPEIVPKALVEGLAATASSASTSRSRVLRSRSKTAPERGAITRYKSLPPRLLAPARSARFD